MADVNPLRAPPAASPQFLREAEIRRGIELLYFGYSNMVKGADVHLAAQGLGRAHHRALYFIARRPGMPIGDLLDLLNITKQSLSRVLGDLQTRGLVVQTVGTRDRRQRMLRLTPAGAALETELFECLKRRRYPRLRPRRPVGGQRLLAGPDRTHSGRRSPANRGAAARGGGVEGSSGTADRRYGSRRAHDFRLPQPGVDFLHRRGEVGAVVGEPHPRRGERQHGQRLHPQRADEPTGRDAGRFGEPRDRSRQAQRHERDEAGIAARGGGDRLQTASALVLRRVEAGHDNREQPVADARVAVGPGLGQRGGIEGAAKRGERRPAVGAASPRPPRSRCRPRRRRRRSARRPSRRGR